MTTMVRTPELLLDVTTLWLGGLAGWHDGDSLLVVNIVVVW